MKRVGDMEHLALEKLPDGVAVVRFSDQRDRMNKLSGPMLTELEHALSEVKSDPGIRSLVFISDKEDNFLVGADLKEIDRATEPGMAKSMILRVHELFNTIEKLPFPVVAAIHGACLGGGLELALACHFRVASDDPLTRLGFPEVNLGLIPAAGGTQRLTRLVGVRRALPLMMRGIILDAAQARAIGLVDFAPYPYELIETVRASIPYFEKRFKKRQRKRFTPTDRLLQYIRPARNIFFAIARKRTRKITFGNYPAPARILECVETGLARGFPAGSATEAQAFDDLVLSDESRALRELFFAVRAMKKTPYADKAKPVGLIGILGSGLMGSGIATVSLQGGIPVVMKDRSWAQLAPGLRRIWTHLDRQARTRMRNPVERDKVLSMLTPATDLDAISRADLVIEAVFEEKALKRRLLSEVEELVGDGCIFASNTSAIPIADIASTARRPENVIGMHYFSPVPRMPLLEVVVTKETADWVIGTAIATGQRQNKTVIVVQDGPGFYTTRTLMPFFHEAAALLGEGAAIKEVDRIAGQFGFPIGPFRLLDEIGIDVAAHVAEELDGFFSKRGFFPPTGLANMVDANCLGRKSAKGFYRYIRMPWEKYGYRIPMLKEPRPTNEGVYQYFGGGKRRAADPLEIRERMVLLMVNEAALCLQEGIIASPRDGDVGAVLGLGFPAFLGGPFRYLDRIGIEQAVAKLERLADRFGARFRPAPILSEMAAKGDVFYGDDLP